jgi:hypothetical protein
VAAAAAAITMQQYAEFESMVAGSALAEQHLPLSAEAQKTNVVRIPGFLSAREVHEIHELYAELKPRLGSAGRTTSNQAAAYRQGKWETAYLSTDGLFAKCMPELRARLIETAARVDADHWQLLPRAVAPVVPRCVEYHTVEAGGSLPFLTHYDAGSLVTIDVMLSDSRDFEGGEFRTLECDGTMRRYPFEKGEYDASPGTHARALLISTGLIWSGLGRMHPACSLSVATWPRISPSQRARLRLAQVPLRHPGNRRPAACACHGALGGRGARVRASLRAAHRTLLAHGSRLILAAGLE